MKLDRSLSLNLKLKRILPLTAKTSPSTPLSQMMSPKFHLTILKYKLNFTQKRTFFQMKVKLYKECYTVILANHSLEI